MIDTGATHTCFDESAARRAGFPIKKPAIMASASHAETRVPVFSGKIVADGLTIDVDQGMGVNLEGFPGLVALIGRDVLQNTLFIYNGPIGSITLSV